MSEPPPLAAAARRLRRPPGRPRTVTGGAPRGETIQGASSNTAVDAAERADFAATLPASRWGRGLPLMAASAYSGIPVRRLWALIAAGRLPVIRIPGMRAVLLDRADLDALLEHHKRGFEPVALGRSGEAFP